MSPDLREDEKAGKVAAKTSPGFDAEESIPIASVELLLPQPRSTEPYFFSHLVLGLGLIPLALVLDLETGIDSKLKRLLSLKKKENGTWDRIFPEVRIASPFRVVKDFAGH